NASLSITNAARLLDDLADASTARTGLGNLKESPRADDLTAAATGRTINRARTRICALALTFAAGIELADFYLFLHAGSGFLEDNLHVVTQVGSTLAPFAISGRTAAKERFENSAGPASATEYFPENIERIMETAAASRSPLGESGMAEAIVGGTLVGIH